MDANPNYQKQMETLMRDIPAGTPLLLHACCGPCASAVLERLWHHFALTVYYYNPNIATKEEHDLRLGALKQLLAQIAPTYPVQLVEVPHDAQAFAAVAKGRKEEPEGGSRCMACFELRLSQTARYAAENGFAWFATTLSVSPHKNAAALNQAGLQAAEQYGVSFLPADFKKKDGYRRSIALSKQYGLYRQSFCGCAFSLAAEG